jgi:hypothetical protein
MTPETMLPDWVWSMGCRVWEMPTTPYTPRPTPTLRAQYFCVSPVDVSSKWVSPNLDNCEEKL